MASSGTTPSGPPKAKAKVTTGGFCRAIDEEVRSLAEQVDHFRSQVPRVPWTVELSDYLTGLAGKAGESPELCYSLDATLDLSDAAVTKETDNGLGSILDKLMLINPSFAQVTELSGGA